MNEREQDILYEIRSMYVSGSGIILPRERLGVVVGYMVELEMRIRDLTTERDGAVAEYQSQLEAFRDEANERQRRLAEERDAARAECDQIRGWMTGYALLREQYAKEYLMRGELGKSDISTVIAQDIAAALNAFPLPDRAALGIESEASE